MEKIYLLNQNPTALRLTGGIIKSAQYQNLVRAEDIVARAKEQAEALVARAKEQAKALVVRAQKQAEATVAEADKIYQHEKERGYREGIEEGQAKISGQITATAAETASYLDNMADRMVELTMRMLKAVIGEMENREIVEKIVFKTLKGIRDDGRITIRVHPECVDHVKEKITRYAAESGQQGLFNVVGEPRLDKDGCILESETGYVDSSMSTQLKAIRESFENGIKKHKATNSNDFQES